MFRPVLALTLRRAMADKLLGTQCLLSGRARSWYRALVPPANLAFLTVPGRAGREMGCLNGRHSAGSDESHVRPMAASLMWSPQYDLRSLISAADPARSTT